MQLKLARYPHQKPLTVRAQRVNEFFAVHPEFAQEGGGYRGAGYVVTHIPSGMRAAKAVRLRDAKAVALALTKAYPAKHWTITTPTPANMKWAKRAINIIREAGGLY